MTVHLNIPDELKALAEARARESGQTLEDYLASLIRADTEQDVSEELERELLEGLNSGPAVEVTPEFWADLKRRGEGRQGR
jgi:antitoxin ParD1/3/4